MGHPPPSLIYLTGSCGENSADRGGVRPSNQYGLPLGIRYNTGTVQGRRNGFSGCLQCPDLQTATRARTRAQRNAGFSFCHLV